MRDFDGCVAVNQHICISSLAPQHIDTSEMVFLCGDIQRGYPVNCGLIDVGSCVYQALHGLLVAQLRGEMQGRLPGDQGGFIQVCFLLKEGIY